MVFIIQIEMELIFRSTIKPVHLLQPGKQIVVIPLIVFILVKQFSSLYEMQIGHSVLRIMLSSVVELHQEMFFVHLNQHRSRVSVTVDSWLKWHFFLLLSRSQFLEFQYLGSWYVKYNNYNHNSTNNSNSNDTSKINMNSKFKKSFMNENRIGYTNNNTECESDDNRCSSNQCHNGDNNNYYDSHN